MCYVCIIEYTRKPVSHLFSASHIRLMLAVVRHESGCNKVLALLSAFLSKAANYYNSLFHKYIRYQTQDIMLKPLLDTICILYIIHISSKTTFIFRRPNHF